MYLCHFLVGEALSAWGIQRWFTSVEAASAVWALTVIAVASVSWYGLERPILRLRADWLGLQAPHLRSPEG
jgi:peptidoglycan/LPS O-acetylase OafA/YrhL